MVNGPGSLGRREEKIICEACDDPAGADQAPSHVIGLGWILRRWHALELLKGLEDLGGLAGRRRCDGEIRSSAGGEGSRFSLAFVLIKEPTRRAMKVTDQVIRSV
jgi:hypothetical protein